MGNHRGAMPFEWSKLCHNVVLSTLIFVWHLFFYLMFDRTVKGKACVTCLVVCGVLCQILIDN